MNCIFCDSPKTQVSNSRGRGSEVWRRRECTQCHSVWTTRETIDFSTSHRIITPSQEAPEHLQRDMLLFMIRDSLQHRNDAETAASHLTDTILTKVLALKTPEIPQAALNEIISETLSAYDPTAAAVYAAKAKFSGPTSLG